MKKKYNKIFDCFFWCPVILTTLSCYLFTITNSSVGIDDPCLFWYIDWKVFLSQGRWGYELISPIVNVSTFLPGWIDLCTVLVYLLTSCVWIVLFYEASYEKFSKESCVIFACIYMSFPYLAEVFIFMAADLPSAFSMFFGSVAALVTWYGMKKKKWLYNIFGALFIALGYGFYETSMIYYLCGILVALFLNEIYGEGCNIRGVIMNLGILIGNVVCGYIISVCARNFFLRYYNMSGSNYTGGYFLYELDSTILLQVVNVFIELFKLIFFNEEVVNRTLAVCMLLWLGYLLLYVVKKRLITPLIYGMGIIFSNFCLILGTGNLALMTSVKRTLVTYGLFVAFSVAMSLNALNDIYFSFREGKTKFRKYIKLVVIVMCGVLVLRQSREMVDVFWADHQRSVLDSNKADHINFEVEKTEWYSKPVIYVGYSQDYIATMQKDPLGSYFYFFNDRTPAEINNFISYYMSAMGYVYPVMMEENMLEEAIVSSRTQPSYPQDGFVTEYEGYIVVKLGE